MLRLKRLALIDPDHERAGEYGPLEAPAFVSPYAKHCACMSCGNDFGPLFYQIGRETRSMHCGPIFTFPPTVGWDTFVWTAAGEQPDASRFKPLGIALDCLRCVECSRTLAPDAPAAGTVAFPLARRNPTDRYLLPVCNRCYWWQTSRWSVELRDGVPLFFRG
jgi:hypothetical protein